MCLLFAGAVFAQSEPGDRDGQVMTQADDSFVAWDANRREWLSPENFWRSFASRERGHRWPEGKTFPPYRDVAEHDTFLVVGDRGACLMIFFHQRWRRGNDVWRWGNEFNEYGGCPYVFDD